MVAQMMSNVDSAMAYGLPVIQAIYPLITLLVMFLPSVSRAFSGLPPASEAPPEEESGWAER
jgi:hypothetical protein